MEKYLVSGTLTLAACIALELGASAQAVFYSTDFADDQGWTLTSSVPPVVWAVDDTPASVLGSRSWHSPPYSLNYNNGVNNTHANFDSTAPWRARDIYAAIFRFPQGKRQRQGSSG